MIRSMLRLVLAAALLAAGCSSEDDEEFLEILTASFPGAQVNVAYSATASAQNGGTPYAWSIASGSLPAGLGLAGATGTISGIPTAVETASFTLRVTDAGGAAVEKAFSIVVAVPPLDITTLRLPPAQVGVAYGQTLQRTGGGAGVTWSVAAGALPTGLTLGAATGMISGITAAGATPTLFVVQVTDGTETDTQRLAIEIDPAVMTLYRVRQDGMGGAYGSIMAAVLAIPSPLPQTLVIEIDDDGTYGENVVVGFTGQTGNEWVAIRSAWNHLATVQALTATLPAVHVQSSRVEIRGLRITGSSGSSGVGVKVDAAVVNVVNCAIFGNETAFESSASPGITFLHNTCHGTLGISGSGGGSCLFINNVVHATGAWAIRSTNCTADYNLYYAPAGAVGSDGTNTYSTLAAWRVFIGQDSHSLSADPLLVNPSGGDLHLQAASPAKDAGTPSAPSLPVTDAEDYARGTGAGRDMGAFELP